MIRYHLWAISIVVSLLAVGCKERIEHADPEAIRQMDAAIGSGTSSTPAGAPAEAVPAGTLVEKLVADAAALFEKLPEDERTVRLSAGMAWHLEQAGRSEEAKSLFEQARQRALAAPAGEGRLHYVSRLIAVSSGGFADAFPSLLVEADRLYAEARGGKKSIRRSNVEESPAYFLRTLVWAGRYQEAMDRIEAEKLPAFRFYLAGDVIRQLAERRRHSDVARSAEIMRQVYDADALHRHADASRSLCSACALADDLPRAEELFKSFPAFEVRPPPVVGRTTPNMPPAFISTAEFRALVDLAAARRRNGDAAGCVHLIETKLGRFFNRDKSFAVAVWVECNEAERAAAIVRIEVETGLKNQLAALLCQALVDRGEADRARAFAAEFRNLVYPPHFVAPMNAIPVSTDIRFLPLRLTSVIPLLNGDAKLVQEWVDSATTDAGRCHSLLQNASLLRSTSQPRGDAYVPDQEITVSGRLFE
jgi:hypothetical protein